MNIAKKLNEELLEQNFLEEELAKLDEYKHIAALYARVENSIAVLSDMHANVSYIYYGKMAERLGLAKAGDSMTVQSIWEKEIFSRIHPDDLQGKHLRELRFFHFLKGIPEQQRTDYYLSSQIRLADKDGRYVPVLHRMFYVARHSNGSIWLALCLYNVSPELGHKHVIINSVKGIVVQLEEQICNELLSDREKNILRFIQMGKRSRDIAQILCISINTVSRHRQNILEKLRVSNSVQAIQLAKDLGMI